MRFDSLLRSNFKPIIMRLLLFILSAICIGIAVGLCSGELQSHVKFNSIESEIFLFLLCSVSGILFLIYSIQPSKNDLS